MNKNDQDLDALIAAEAEHSERVYEAEQQGLELPMRTDTVVTRGHARTRVLQVRLNDDELTMLEARAERAGIPVSTLARSILLGQAGDITAAVEEALRHTLRPDLFRAA
jgi:predicted DNA binding CopG/RHH family protein